MTFVVGFLLVFVITAWFGNPLPVFGFDQSPEQPIAYPHPVHAGTDVVLDADGNTRLDDQGAALRGLGLDCTFCHRLVTRTNVASIPPVAICTTCHRVMGPAGSESLTTLREYGLGESPGPIQWKRVHRLPDHVRFVHEPHIRFLTANPGRIANPDEVAIAAATAGGGGVNAALVCSTCHGDVKSMAQVQQVEPLKMGQCVDCHRKNDAPVGCSTCHY
ncbi:MAG: hypothetical protein V3S18_04960 [Dehalococcoidia bacterium]